MSLLGAGLEKLLEEQHRALEEARALAIELLTPRPPIPRSSLAHLLRRALRNGGWKRLTREQRALLLAAVKAGKKVYKAKPLVDLLRVIWLEVELATTRGKAVLAALAKLLSESLNRLWNTLRRGLHSLITLGLQHLNHPLLRLAS